MCFVLLFKLNPHTNLLLDYFIIIIIIIKIMKRIAPGFRPVLLLPLSPQIKCISSEILTGGVSYHLLMTPRKYEFFFSGTINSES